MFSWFLEWSYQHGACSVKLYSRMKHTHAPLQELCVVTYTRVYTDTSPLPAPFLLGKNVFCGALVPSGLKTPRQFFALWQADSSGVWGAGCIRSGVAAGNRGPSILSICLTCSMGTIQSPFKIEPSLWPGQASKACWVPTYARG